MLTAERQELALRHYPMAQAIARRIHHRLPNNIDVDDLISAGVTGLLEAIDRYDSTRAVPFEVYAKHRIHGAVVDALRAQDWVSRSVRRKATSLTQARKQLTENLGRSPHRSEMAVALNVSMNQLGKLERDSQIRPLISLDGPVSKDNSTLLVELISDGHDLMESWTKIELKKLTLDSMRRLPEKERTAIALYYLHDLSLKDTGRVMGITESRACQLCSSGIKRLKFRLRQHAN